MCDAKLFVKFIVNVFISADNVTGKEISPEFQIDIPVVPKVTNTSTFVIGLRIEVIIHFIEKSLNVYT